MPIKLLDDDMINKIAAGEVIERPASIVKELIENAIDAGASRISVSIAGGGRESIEVEDNGRGINFDEVPLAFLRHATSKISREEDLQNINTMGFRGEALPSIASVSRIDLYSKPEQQEGVYAFLEGGQITQQKIYPTPAGTRIIVRDLFYNTPARKNFLKTVVTESNHINELMCKYALARPDICFSYRSEKKMYFKTPGNSSLTDALVSVFGRDFADNLIDVSYQGEEYKIAGLMSTPEIKRANRKNQIFFINNRPIRSPLLYRAVDTAYKGMLLSREYPVVILSIRIDPAVVDVNVHPQKSEVRFKDENGMFRIIHHVLKQALGERNYSASLSYFDTGVNDGKTGLESVIKHHTHISQQPIFDNTPQANMGNSKNYYSECIYEDKCAAEYIKSDNEFRIIGQVFDTYILLEKDDSLWIADQHAAHERIIFSRLLDEYANSTGSVQQLVFPITLELSSRQLDIIENHQDFFESMGFDIQVIGHSSIALRSVPVVASGQEKHVLYEILDNFDKKDIPDIKRQALAVMSCKKAVKAGMVLKFEEMARIIKDLFESRDYQHCPHGRPTIIRLSHEDMERMFKRI